MPGSTRVGYRQIVFDTDCKDACSALAYALDCDVKTSCAMFLDTRKSGRDKPEPAVSRHILADSGTACSKTVQYAIRNCISVDAAVRKSLVDCDQCLPDWPRMTDLGEVDDVG